MSDEGLKVIELKVQGFMGIKLASVKPDGDIVVIGGRNGQGKTSLLNAIECAIRGKKYHPDRPVREGSKSGEVTLDLGALKIRRRFTPEGGSTIKVETSDGMKPQRPQELLDALAGAIAFDPLEFSRFDPKERLTFVRELSGVSVDDLEAERAKKFEERTDFNRQAKQYRSQLAGMTLDEWAPDAEVSVAELVEERERVRSEVSTQDAARANRSELVGETEALTRTRDNLKADLTQIETDIVVKSGYVTERTAQIAKFEDLAPELSRLDSGIATAEETNQKVRGNALYGETESRALDAETESQKRTDRIQTIDEEKSERITSAQLPVEGLSFGDDGVTLNGIPFDQISGSERLRASVGMGMALNPKLRVMLIRDGSLLDEESMELLAQMAEEHGYQCWVERVGTSDVGAIVIEDGEVVSAAEAQGEAA